MNTKKLLVVAFACCLWTFGCSEDTVSSTSGENNGQQEQPGDGDQPGNGDDQPGGGDDQPGDNDQPNHLCGNGHIDEGEACDDGNEAGGDGCSADCKSVEENWFCDKEGEPCTQPTCGDNEVDPGEECDEGEFNADYGRGNCSTRCRYDAHYCGDGLWDEADRAAGEECDSGGVDTSSEYDGCSLFCERGFYCGDGRRTHQESCDDGNDVDGDGCSSKCQTEPGWVCKTDGEPCTATILLTCGNRKLEEGEACDDGNAENGDGCSSLCQVEKGWRCSSAEDGASVCEFMCGNGIVDEDAGEVCDDGNAESGDGCTSLCSSIEAGYVCPLAGSPCFARACGDGIVAGNEECDDGNVVSGDGCSKMCRRESDWACPEKGGKCHRTNCGDGVVEGDETCDEGHNVNPGNKTDGCDSCNVQMGWQCLVANTPCTQDAVWGNGILEGAEECDEGQNLNSSNKTAGCEDGVITVGWRCPKAGQPCEQGVCGDGIVDKGEECDDRNNAAGDGCSPVCTREPIFDCTDDVCKPICGDGIVIYADDGTPLEECDDGNLINGDGCSSECKFEPGFVCETPKIDGTPVTMNVPIVYRDFRAYHPNYTNNQDHGYPTLYPTTPGYFSEEEFASLPERCKDPAIIRSSGYRFRHFPKAGTPIPDFQGNSCYGNNLCTNVVYPTLGDLGRPRLRPASEITKSPQATSAFDNYETCAQLYTCPEIFDYWYKDSDMSVTIATTLPLTRQTDGTYKYTSSDFWPLTNLGYNAPDAAQTYGKRETKVGLFTSEFQSYFKFRGNEEFRFSGDDDVWVYFNDHLVIELAGIHGDKADTIKLTEAVAAKYGMYPGGIYPMHMFHAERCNGGSRFTLTLSGFVNMAATTCNTVCGDGIVRGSEECDPVVFANPAKPTTEELEAARVAGCVSCRVTAYCGNGVVEPGEGCDPGEKKETWCDPDNCQITTCGNGILDEHEQCEYTITDPSDINYRADCQPTCLISGCGDGIVSGDEECDDGNKINDDMCSNACERPKCGDAIVQEFMGEVCDDGINDGSYGGCGFDCSYFPPRCGDAIVSAADGEECDDGVNDGSYETCSPTCKRAGHCGDGIIQTEYEECDDGELNGTAGHCPARCRTVIF